jgi:predicted glycoside hydrolase/deacetylase ChbG (UPF0249 family)
MKTKIKLPPKLSEAEAVVSKAMTSAAEVLRSLGFVDATIRMEVSMQQEPDFEVYVLCSEK